MVVKRSLSAISAKMADSEDELTAADKPKVRAGIDTDGAVFQITLPLMVNEDDLTITEAKKPNSGETYDKANVCYSFEALGLTLGVKMNDGTVRYYKIKKSAGPYGPTRYLSFGFDPTVFFSRPVPIEADIEADEETDIVEHVPAMMAASHE